MRREIQVLSKFVTGTHVPQPVLAEAARLSLDALACMAGGAQTSIGRAARALAEPVAGAGASVVAKEVPSSWGAAARANARTGFALDADDTFMMLHFGVPAVAAAFAVGEAEGASGRAVLEAIAVGFEAGARMLRAVGPVVEVRDGCLAGYRRPQAAPVGSVFAATGAAARILGLSDRAVADAFSIAGANTPLPAAHKWAEDPAGGPLPTYKYSDAGACAAVGVDAAFLAAQGITGMAGLFEGGESFWDMCGGLEGQIETLIAGLGEAWQILDTSYKPWPSCRWLHYPLTALAELKAREAMSADDVEEIVVRGPATVCGSTRRTTPSPRGWIAAEFNLTHSIAMVLLGIDPGVAWYASETMVRPDVRRIRAQVRAEVDPAANRLGRFLDRGHLKGVACTVEIRIGGRTLVALAERAKGDPWHLETRLTDADLAAKLKVMTGGASSDGLARAVLQLAMAPSLAEIGAAMRGFQETDRTADVVLA